MSTETTNKKIKIDNGTTFGRTYTDKAVDELLKNVGGGEILELNETDSATIINLFTGENIPSGVQNFTTNYAVKDYSKVKFMMNETAYYLDVSNKQYMPNAGLTFYLLNNYHETFGSSLDYIIIKFSIDMEKSTYKCYKFSLNLITN